MVKQETLWETSKRQFPVFRLKRDPADALWVWLGCRRCLGWFKVTKKLVVRNQGWGRPCPYCSRASRLPGKKEKSRPQIYRDLYLKEDQQ